MGRLVAVRPEGEAAGGRGAGAPESSRPGMPPEQHERLKPWDHQDAEPAGCRAILRNDH